jgi:hypothetical protein
MTGVDRLVGGTCTRCVVGDVDGDCSLVEPRVNVPYFAKKGQFCIQICRTLVNCRCKTVPFWRGIDAACCQGPPPLKKKTEICKKKIMASLLTSPIFFRGLGLQYEYPVLRRSLDQSVSLWTYPILPLWKNPKHAFLPSSRPIPKSKQKNKGIPCLFFCGDFCDSQLMSRLTSIGA